MMRDLTLLDGAVGTELQRRGLPTDGPGWSAGVLAAHGQALARLHAEYAAAGATVHTAATFRTTARGVGADWPQRTRQAVRLARQAVPAAHRVAGSMAPLADCYHPEQTPEDPGPTHQAHADCLASAGVDLLLCETFADPAELRTAAAAALSTGLPTWAAMSPGPFEPLITPAQGARLARELVSMGVERVLVNCLPARDAGDWLPVLADCGAPWGIYANAGSKADGLGWGAAEGPARYARLARQWVAAGATAIGGCCGTGPAHIAALREALS